MYYRLYNFHIIKIMWLFLTSQKSKLLYLPSANIARFYSVDTSSFNAGMTQNIGKSDNILLQTVICSCKQVTEVVRKNLILWHSGGFAKIFKHFPYIAPVKRFSVSAYKDWTVFYALFRDIFFQHSAKLFRQKYCPHFSLATYNCLSLFYSLTSYKP